jgi:hypothetical protein
MSLVDALVDRRIPRTLLRRLLRRCLRGEGGSGKSQYEYKEKIVCMPMAWFPLLTSETAGQLVPNRNPPSGRQGA